MQSVQKLRWHHAWRYVGWGSVIVASVVAARAQAEQDSYQVLAGASTQYDSNYRRVSPDSTIDEIESDQINSAYVGVNLDKSYSLQRFLLDGIVTEYRFAKNSDFDNQGKDINARWLWSITPRLTGALAASHTEQLTNLRDLPQDPTNNRIQKNVGKTSNAELTGDWRVTGGWHLVGGLREELARNELATLAAGDYHLKRGEAGVRYVSSAGNALTWMAANATGEYAKRVVDSNRRIDSGFEQVETSARLDWLPTAKSKFSGRLGYLQREHNNYSDRDFSGVFGGLDYSWSLDDRLRIDAGVKQVLASFQSDPQRDLSAIQKNLEYFNSSYYEAQSLSLGPRWQATPKTAIGLRFGWESRQFLGGLVEGVHIREDVVTFGRVNMEWNPLDNIKLGVDFQSQTGSSTVNLADFSADTIGLTLAASF